jgi:hypothetical protein
MEAQDKEQSRGAPRPMTKVIAFLMLPHRRSSAKSQGGCRLGRIESAPDSERMLTPRTVKRYHDFSRPGCERKALTGTKVTDAGVADLRRALPGVTIEK